MREDNKSYSYLDAGFNRFFSRKISGGSQVQTLSGVSAGKMASLNFDQMHVSGALGDTLKIGNIFLDGANGRIDIQDDNSNVIARFGQEAS